MKGFLIRVGIDTTNIGYCAPVFSDNHFEYIPIPQFNNETSENLRYGTMKARTHEGKFLSDFMHTDRHSYVDESGNPYIRSIDENGESLLAKDLTPHFDPEFTTDSFGDFWAEGRGRIPSDLRPEDCVFFYAGLSRCDPSFYERKRTWEELKDFQMRNKCAFLIGFLKIEKIFEIRTEQDLLASSEEIWNNAHFKENIVPTVILKGKNESKLLDKAIQLNYWQPEIGKYNPTDIGSRIGLVPMSGVRIMKWLDEPLCNEVAETINNYH